MGKAYLRKNYKYLFVAVIWCLGMLMENVTYGIGRQQSYIKNGKLMTVYV